MSQPRTGSIKYLEEDRLLRDFEEYGYNPVCAPEWDDVEYEGWIMFSPKDANAILEEIWRLRDLEF